MRSDLDAEVMYQAFRIGKRLKEFGVKCGLFQRRGRFWVRPVDSKEYRDTVWYSRGELLAIYTPNVSSEYIEDDVADVLLRKERASKNG